MAEAIDELGLDITSFQKAIDDAVGHLQTMSPALKQIDAELGKMAQLSKQAGDAAKKHATDLVTLRNELRAVQKEYNSQSVASENSPEQKARKARIDGLKQEVAERQKASTAAKQYADALGKDYATASSQRDKMAPGIQRADAAKQRKEDQDAKKQEIEDAKQRRIQDQSGTRALAAFVAVAYLAGRALRFLSDNFLSAGENFIKASQLYQAGGSKLNANAVNPQSAGLSIGIKSLVDDQIAKLKAGAASAAGGFLKAIGGIIQSRGGTDKKSGEEYFAGVQDVEEKGKQVLAINEKIVSSQDELAELQKQIAPDLQTQAQIQAKLLDISRLREELASHELVQNREAANAAKQEQGQIAMEFRGRKQAQLDANTAAESETRKIKEAQAGYARIAELSKMRLDYEVKIQDAKKNGLLTVASELSKQRDMLMLASAIAEKNMTARERISERNTARKYASDAVKVGRQSVENDRSLDNAGVTDEASLNQAIKDGRITRGSRLDRAARAKFSGAASDAYAQASMSIRSMSVTTITTTNLNVATPP